MKFKLQFLLGAYFATTNKNGPKLENQSWKESLQWYPKKLASVPVRCTKAFGKYFKINGN